MNVSSNEPRQAGWLTRILFKVAGADEETLRLCRQEEWDRYRALGLLLLASVVYETAVFSLVAHETLAPDHQIHIGLVAGAFGIAILIGAVDRQLFLVGGTYGDGLRELARGGLALPSSLADRTTGALLLVVRIVFSLALAQLTAIAMGLLLWQPEIDSALRSRWRQQNAVLIEEAKKQAETEIQRAADAAKLEEANVASLQTRLGAMRDGAVNPSANDPAVKARQAEVDRLAAEKAQRDAELVAAQAFASDELAGLKTGPRNSGVPGRGPVRVAAEERITTATANAAATDRALADARARLDELLKQAAAGDGERSRQAQLQLPDLAKELEAATAHRTELRDNLTALATRREARIRELVESAPDHVGRDEGLLARLGALKRIAQDLEFKFVIGLVDIVSCILELALILAKTATARGGVYAALMVRESYMRTVRVVEGMIVELDRGPDPEGDASSSLGMRPANDNGGDPHLRASPGPIPAPGDLPPPPQKRPRGRPRKRPPRLDS